jgi:hypothetical protein
VARDYPRQRPGPKPGKRRGPINVDAKPTEAQLKLVALLGKAYEIDVPVAIGPRTRWAGQDGTCTASRTVARGVVAQGLARYSEPNARFLLLTERGKALAGVAPLDRVKLPS